MAIKPTIINSRTERYDLNYKKRSFTVEYTHNNLIRDDRIISLDSNVTLGETVPIPFNIDDLSELEYTRTHTKKIREVVQNYSTGQNEVEIKQSKDIPEGLEELIDELPSHVKNLLRTEYSDPGVTPYNFDDS